jgi:Tol biopolymer transport system component
VVDRGVVRQLTSAGINTHPTWMPEGSRLAIAAIHEGSDGYDVYTVPDNQNAGAVTDRIIGRPGNQFPSGFSRQGNVLAFYELGDGGRDILVWSPKEGVSGLMATPSNERLATFSKDGRFIAYVSDDYGRDEVWVRKYPLALGGPVQISSDGGTEPVWSPSGNELFFRRRTELVSVRIGADARALAPPVTVLDGPYELARPEVGRPNYDVFPGGRSFVMVRTGEIHRQVPLIVNWFSELQRQPAGR